MRTIAPNLIQSFIYFCESQTIEAAARKIGITQPALSKQLKSLELQLPHKMFTFKGKKKVLTPFGNNMYLELKDHFSSIQNTINQTCNSYGKIENSWIKIGARSEVIDRVAGKLDFKGRIDFLELGHKEIISKVMLGALDIGITHSSPLTYELGSKKLFKENFKLVTPKKYDPNINSLIYSPCISYKENDPILQSSCKALKVRYEDLNIKRTISNYKTISNMIEDGVGWSIIPNHISTNTRKCTISKIKLNNIVTKDFILIYRTEHTKIQWFIDLSKKIKKLFI